MGNNQNNKKKSKENDKNNITKDICKYYILFIGKIEFKDNTNLIQRIEEGQYIDKNKKYIKKIVYEKDNKEFILYLIDSNATFEESEINDKEIEIAKIVKEFYFNADCIIMGYDINNKQSFEEMKTNWNIKIKDKIKTDLIYLLENKTDLKDNIEVTENEGKEFADKNNIKYFQIADKEKDIKNLMYDIKMSIEKIDYNSVKLDGNPSKSKYKISFIGDSEVGTKTSLIKRLIYDKFNQDYDQTYGAQYYPKIIKFKNGKEIIMNLWDNPGMEKLRPLVKIIIKESDAVILGYDITKRESYDSIKNFWYKISKDNSYTDLIYLIASKIDLYEKVVEGFGAKNYAEENNMRYCMISCKNSWEVKEFENDLITQLIKKHVHDNDDNLRNILLKINKN